MMAGILENAEPEAPVEEEVTEEITSTVDPAGTPAVDAPQRPEYLDEQFWNATKGEANVEAMAKSYKELRKTFNERNNDKPGETVEDYMQGDNLTEDGKYKVDDYEVLADDPALTMAFEAAKEAGLGTKQAQAFINKFIGGMQEFAPQGEAFDPQAELAKLGPDANKVVTGIKTWVDGMKTNGEVTDEVYNEILNLGKTAAGIQALNVLRQKTGEHGIPTGEAITGTSHMSAQDWYSASFETHAESGESHAQYDDRMHAAGKKIFGTGAGNFTGTGFGMGDRR